MREGERERERKQNLTATFPFPDALEFIISVRGEEGSLDESADGGATPLHYAVAGGHEDCVRVLLHFGANVNSITLTDEVSHGP